MPSVKIRKDDTKIALVQIILTEQSEAEDSGVRHAVKIKMNFTSTMLMYDILKEFCENGTQH
jgi:hypothetical protein